MVASVCLLGVAAVSMLSRNMGAATTTQFQITPLQKPLFGEMTAGDIEQLFAKFQSDYNRNYADEHELAFRFETFKQNLKLIDRLNNENPLALFTITNSADYTDTERNQRRMKGKFANYTAMKEQLPESILSTKDEALKKFDADARSVRPRFNYPPVLFRHTRIRGSPAAMTMTRTRASCPAVKWRRARFRGSARKIAQPATNTPRSPSTP